MSGRIRAVVSADFGALHALIEAIDLFPADELAGMMVEYFATDRPSDHRWIVYEDDRQLVGAAYFSAERMTVGTWNLYFIGVRPDRQRAGIGAALLRYVEDTLASVGVRLLLVETSGLESFAGTREFYRVAGYTEEARLREFYQIGEDKIVYRKALSEG